MSRDPSGKNENRSFLSNWLKKAEPVELKSLPDVRHSGEYGAFYPIKSASQTKLEKFIESHKEKFSSYTAKVKATYENAQISSNKRWEKNVEAFTDLYRDIYGIDLCTATALEGVENTIKELQQACSLNNKEDETNSMAFTFVRENIAEAVPKIIRGIELRAARLNAESEENTATSVNFGE